MTTTTDDARPLRLAACHRTAITDTMRGMAQDVIAEYGDGAGTISVLVDRQDGDMARTLRVEVPESPVWRALETNPGWYLVVVTWGPEGP